MESTTTSDYPLRKTIEETWEFLKKSSEDFDRRMKERDAEFERQKKEREAEAERQKKEREAEAERQKAEFERQKEESERRKAEREAELREINRIVKRNSKQMGDLHRRFGQLAEHLVAPGIAKRFNELGYHFDEMSPGGHKVLDERGKVKTEVDILLENGDCIVAVEVKATPRKQDVEHHIKRMEILRGSRSKRHDERKILGAVAGAIYDDDVKQTVREAGMFVIEQSGDTMMIDMPDNFVPREW